MRPRCWEHSGRGLALSAVAIRPGVVPHLSASWSAATAAVISGAAGHPPGKGWGPAPTTQEASWAAWAMTVPGGPQSPTASMKSRPSAHRERSRSLGRRSTPAADRAWGVNAIPTPLCSWVCDAAEHRGWASPRGTRPYGGGGTSRFALELLLFRQEREPEAGAAEAFRLRQQPPVTPARHSQ